MADHLSRIVHGNINDTQVHNHFPDEQLLSISSAPWYADIVNYLFTNETPSHWSKQDKQKFLSNVRNF